MFKKTMALFGVSAILVFGVSSAASAYTVDDAVVVEDSTLTPGEGTTVTVLGVDEPEDTVAFTVSGPGGESLASLVAASAQTSVTKSVPGAQDTASAEFNATVPGDHTVTVTGYPSGKVYGSVVINVSASGSSAGGSGGGSADGLAVTGGVVPAAALWLGIGAIGIGGIAVAAVAARRRSAGKR